VWATDVDEKGLASLEGCRTRRLNVLDQADITAAFAEIGTPDILFNCAGWVAGGTILECSDEDFDRSFEFNVKAMFRVMRAALPGMLTRGSGSIVNISSVAGATMGVPNRFAYGASKAAVVGMTRAIAADYVQKGIRCNAICPGTVDTPSLRQRLSATGDFDTAYKAFAARQPMGRIGTAEEIASIAVYLASDEASFTTGQCFFIDGGWSNQ
jgi:2-keto-3-deoxy-L-fuconate dehydrogenase